MENTKPQINKPVNLKRNLFLSILFFALCCWLASYIVLPYFAFGGSNVYGYNYHDPRNFFLNIILPTLLFLPCIFFGNYHAKKALPIAGFDFIWLLLIVVTLAIMSFGVFCAFMFIFPFNMGYFLLAWILGMIALLNILIWSTIAFKRAYLKRKERTANAN